MHHSIVPSHVYKMYVICMLEMQQYQYIDIYRHIVMHWAVILYDTYLGRIDISNIVIYRCINIKTISLYLLCTVFYD